MPLALSDASAEVRNEALRGLAYLDRRPDPALLGRLVRDDEDPEIRLTSLEMLAKQRGPIAHGALEDALADPDLLIREVAEAALRTDRDSRRETCRR